MLKIALIALLTSQSWTTDCIMSQSTSHQGYSRETATFTTADTLKYSFKTEWFSDSGCNESQNAVEEIEGSILIGEVIAGGMNGKTFEADFVRENKTELGAIEINTNQKSIRLSKTSFGNSRNTMLSLFPYFGTRK